MTDETTDQEESIFSDVDPNSTEELEQAQAKSDVSMDSKFMTKTNQKLADMAKLSSLTLRGKKPQEIMELDPELAQRLSRHKEFEGVFVDDDYEEDLETKIERKVQERLGATEMEKAKKEAFDLFRLGGKPLSSEDKRILKENPKFSKSFDALISGGVPPEEAMQTSFLSAFHDKPAVLNKILRSESVLAPALGSGISEPRFEEPNNLSQADLKFIQSRKNRDALVKRKKV